MKTNEKLWAVQGTSGKLVELMSGEVEMHATEGEAEAKAYAMGVAFGKQFTPVYMK